MTKDKKQKNKKITLKKVYIPKKVQDDTGKFLVSKRLKKNCGQETTKDYGLVEKWQGNKSDIEYLVQQSSLNKFKEQPPKVYVSQDKNVKLLLAFVEEQQFNKRKKKAECLFTLTEYAKMRGYSDDEIAKGGKFLTELRRDLYSGAYTVFKVPFVDENGEEYTMHGSFYSMIEPKTKRGKWKIRFNAWYSDAVEEVLEKQSERYFVHYLKEIADRKTTENPLLHSFYNQLVYRKRKSQCTTPKKVYNLLAEMNVSDDYLKRPPECFRILTECMSYIAKEYPEEIESIYLFNDFNKENTKKLPLKSLQELNKWKYSEFQEVLKPLGLDDIRDCYISFCRQNIKALQVNNDTPTPDKLIDEILEWVSRWEKIKNYKINFNQDERVKFLQDSCRLIGFEKVKDLFKQESQRPYPNAYDFLVVVLSAEIKKNKRVKEELNNIKKMLENRVNCIKSF